MKPQLLFLFISLFFFRVAMAQDCVTPQPDAGSDDSTCGNSYTLSANLDNGNSGEWSVVAGYAAAVSFTDKSRPNTIVTINNDMYGSYTFRWTEYYQGKESCAASDDVTITFNKKYDATLGAIDDVCSQASLIRIQATDYGTLSSSPSTNAFDSESAILDLSLAPAGIYTITNQFSSPTCANPNTSTTHFTVKDVIEISAFMISSGSISFNALNKSNSSQATYKVNGSLATPFYTDASPDDKYSYRVTDDNGCSDILLNGYLNNAYAGYAGEMSTYSPVVLNATETAGSKISMTGSTSVGGSVQEFLVYSGIGDFSTDPLIRFSDLNDIKIDGISGLNYGTSYYIYPAIGKSSDDGKHIDLTSDQKSITPGTPVVWLAPITADAGPDQVVYGSFATLAGNQPAPEEYGHWTCNNPFTPTGGKTKMDIDAIVTVPTEGDYTFTWNIRNQVDTNSDDVIITFKKIPEITVDNETLPEVNYTITNFTLGADGKVAYQIDEGAVLYSESSPITFSGLTEGTHELEMTLVDMDGNALISDIPLTKTVSFQVVYPPHADDVEILKNILEQSSGATTPNYTLLGLDELAYKSLQLADWEDNGIIPGLTWVVKDGIKRLEKLEWSNSSLLATDKLGGNWDLKGLEELKVLNCDDNALTGIDVSGLNKLDILSCANNQIPFSRLPVASGASYENDYKYASQKITHTETVTAGQTVSLLPFVVTDAETNIKINGKEYPLDNGGRFVVPSDCPLGQQEWEMTNSAFDAFTLNPLILALTVDAAPTPSYNIKVEKAPGILYTGGEWQSVAEGNNLIISFKLEDNSLRKSDILLLLDGKEVDTSQISSGTNEYSYTLKGITADHSIIIAQQRYNVTLPRIEGITTDPSAGTHKAPYDQPFNFTVTLADEYDQSDIHIYINGEELNPNELRSQIYSYTVKEVKGPLEIEIKGVTSNPVSNMQISETTRLYATGGILYIETTDLPQNIAIYTVTGIAKVQYTLMKNTTSFALPQALYIVKVGKEIYKVVIH